MTMLDLFNYFPTRTSLTILTHGLLSVCLKYCNVIPFMHKNGNNPTFPLAGPSSIRIRIHSLTVTLWFKRLVHRAKSNKKRCKAFRVGSTIE